MRLELSLLLESTGVIQSCRRSGSLRCAAGRGAPGESLLRCIFGSRGHFGCLLGSARELFEGCADCGYEASGDGRWHVAHGTRRSAMHEANGAVNNECRVCADERI